MPEGRTLDFKRDGVGTNDEAKREFLCDVSALANTQGGQIIYGMDEHDGVATALVGFDLKNPDEEIGRILQVLNSGLEPKLPSVQSALVPLDGGKYALVVRTRASHIAPHRVIFRDHAKFYKRHGSSKMPMDTFELRLAFNAAQGVPAQIEAIHARLTHQLTTGHAPVPADMSKPYFVVSVIPVEAVSGEVELDIQLHNCLMPLDKSGDINYFHTFDSYVSFRATSEIPSCFALTGRSGYTQYAFRPTVSERGYFHMQNVEKNISESVRRSMDILTSRHALSGPFSIHLSTVRCDLVAAVWNEHSIVGGRSRNPTEKRLDFHPVVIDEFSDGGLLPIARSLWFAFGQERPRDFPLGGT